MPRHPAPQAAYRFQQIVPGVYSAIGAGTMNVGSNSAIIMTTHKPHSPTINAPGVNAGTVARMYEVMEHRADQ